MLKKRVGLLVDSASLPKQVADLISLSKQAENYEIVVLLINNFGKQKKNIFHESVNYIRRRSFKKFINASFFKLICKFEELVLKRIDVFNCFYSERIIDKNVLRRIIVEPKMSKNGLVYRYGEKDIKQIKELDLDVLVRAGSGILRGSILNVCPHGVISFHHADNDVNRGGPPGFWEVYYKFPKTGFIIQRLKNELDGGDVLYKGFVSTHWLYSANKVRLIEVANPFFHKVLEDITSSNPKFKVHKKNPYSNRLYTTPSILQAVNYLLKTASIILRRVSRKIQGRGYRWGVAYQFSERWNDVVLWRSKRIPNPRNRFLADPFVIKHNGAHFCFVEDLDFASNKGCISAYKITPSAHEFIGVALEEDFHLSFPYIFKYENELFMCPETCKKEEIRIYKCIEFPTKWVFHKTLMKNVSAADTIIFERDSRWWMLTNIDESPIADHSCQLHIFSADSPLSEKWVANDNNPVIFDPLIARNGGLIMTENETYRVFQRQGFDMYGEGMGIARIAKLSETEYVEEVCSSIEPKFFDGLKGTHTYNFDGELIVLDFVEICRKQTGF